MSSGVPVEDAREGYKKVQLGPREVALPEEWDIRPVNELFEIEKNSFDPDGIDPDSEILLYSMPAFDSGREPIQTQASGIGSKKYRVPEDTILFPKLNIRKRRFWRVQHNHSQPAVCSTEFWPLVPKVSLTLEFYHYYFDSQEFMSNPKVTSSSSTNSHKRVKQTSFEKLQLSIPPLPEQRRIADILSTVDEQIQQTDEIIEQRKELTQGLVDELVLTGISDNPSIRSVQIGPKQIDISESWDLFRVDELVSGDDDAIRTGPFGSKLKKEYLVSEGMKVYEQSNVYEQDFSKGDRYVTQDRYESELTSYDARAGDVLITLQGTVGDAGVLPEDAEAGVINQKLMRVRVNRDICLPEYFAIFFDESYLANFQIGAVSHGAVVSGLNISTISGIRVPIPPLNEQRKIIEILNASKENLRQEQETKQHLQELKRGLMQDLLTGKVRVTADD